MSQEVKFGEGSLLAEIMAEERFTPSVPGSLEETGLPTSLIESLIVKYLLQVGSESGHNIAKFVKLPYGLLDDTFGELRTRKIVVHDRAAPLNDYYYSLTEQGREQARTYLRNCAYTGAAPVRLIDYVLSVEAQSIRDESPKRAQLEEAFKDISVNTDLFEDLGPAINSGAGMFLYGSPGNGKSTLAKRITMCFGDAVWVPYAVVEDNQIIKIFDRAYHTPIRSKETGSLVVTESFDGRWVKIRRPTVTVGGELTLSSLEIQHNPTSNVSEAPLQMKSNCGCLLIDDFGRQLIDPSTLLNRWIVPLENRVDYLTLATGKKIQVPFEQLIIFSTNLEPKDLVDEAFLRRIPYKIKIDDANEQEFHDLFRIYAEKYNCPYTPETVDYLIQKHYKPQNRPMRRCHPRDLLGQIRNYCNYNGLPMEMKPEYFDRVVRSYFTVLIGQ